MTLKLLFERNGTPQCDAKRDEYDPSINRYKKNKKIFIDGIKIFNPNIIKLKYNIKLKLKEDNICINMVFIILIMIVLEFMENII